MMVIRSVILSLAKPAQLEISGKHTDRLARISCPVRSKLRNNRKKHENTDYQAFFRPSVRSKIPNTTRSRTKIRTGRLSQSVGPYKKLQSVKTSQKQNLRPVNQVKSNAHIRGIINQPALTTIPSSALSTPEKSSAGSCGCSVSIPSSHVRPDRSRGSC